MAGPGAMTCAKEIEMQRRLRSMASPAISVFFAAAAVFGLAADASVHEK